MINSIFFGSSIYSIPLLEALKKCSNLQLIITRPDRPVGRKQILTPTPVKEFAQKHHIPLITPIHLRTAQEQETTIHEMNQIQPDIALVADYGLIIPEDIFEIPRYKTVNIHFSRLPHYRGPSPVQYSILNGEKNAWISFMLIEEGLDTGPIIFQKEFPISSFATTNTLYAHLFEEAAQLLPDVINGYIKGTYVPQIQDSRCKIQDSQTTQHIEKSSAFIPWHLLQDAIHGTEVEIEKRPEFLKQFEGSWPNLVERSIRAFSPWPEIWTELVVSSKQLVVSSKKKRLKIKKAYLNSTNHLRLLIVQLEGKNPVSWEEFTTGYTALT